MLDHPGILATPLLMEEISVICIVRISHQETTSPQWKNFYQISDKVLTNHHPSPPVSSGSSVQLIYCNFLSVSHSHSNLQPYLFLIVSPRGWHDLSSFHLYLFLLSSREIQAHTLVTGHVPRWAFCSSVGSHGARDPQPSSLAPSRRPGSRRFLAEQLPSAALDGKGARSFPSPWARAPRFNSPAPSRRPRHTEVPRRGMLQLRKRGPRRAPARRRASSPTGSGGGRWCTPDLEKRHGNEEVSRQRDFRRFLVPWFECRRRSPIGND
jgi:hypothetical protein